MDPELLRVLLPSDYSGDLPSLWSRYAGEEADPNPYGFITWLFHEGELSAEAARDALTSGRAVLSIWDDPNQVLELTDATLHVPLLVLGGVIAGVLAQVALLAGAFDLLGDLDATAGGQVVELGLQTVEGGSGELL